MPLLSTHADYRREDYVFARTQSRALQEMEWDRREERLHSWSELALPALGIAGVALAMLEVLH